MTTASYTGEIKAEGVEAVKYTVTYLGSPWDSWLASIPCGSSPGRAFAACRYRGIIYIMKRPRAVIYAMNARGVAYKKLGKQKISTRTPKLDLTKLREYPAGDASVELPSKLAHKLAGRIITIQMYGGSRTHLVEAYDGQDSYWFAIKEDAEEKEESES